MLYCPIMALRQSWMGVEAPEFPRGLQWLNTARPLSMKALRGKVVLIEFWAYSCVNCLRVLPYLLRWHEKYERLGFIVIGVHSPEFEFEKDRQNVQEAVKKFGVKFPVVLDNDYRIWNLYSNAWWPRKFIVNSKREIVFDHIGEGAYREAEEKIRELLMRELHWPKDVLGEPEPHEKGTADACYQTTPEMYLGYGRGRIGTNDLLPDTEARYLEPARPEANQWYLSGAWIAKRDYIERMAGEDDAWLHLKFSAFSVNCVMGSADRSEIMVSVTLNGRSLSEENKGRDVEILPDGSSVVRVSGPRMYNLLSSSGFLDASLKLFVRKRGLKCFVFTFGGCNPASIKEAVWRE